MTTPTLRRIGAQGWFEFTAILRNGEQILLNVIMPVLAVLVLAKTSIVRTDSAPWQTETRALTAGLALAVMSSAFTSIAIATGFDRRAGFLRYLGTTPLKRGGLIAGKVVAVLALVLIQIGFLTTTAIAVGWQFDLGGLLLALVPILLATGAFAAWALLLAGSLRAEAVLALANLIWLMLVMSAGVILAAPALPDAVLAALKFLPSTALTAAIGSALDAHTLNLGATITLLGWLITGGFAANRWFKWD